MIRRAALVLLAVAPLAASAQAGTVTANPEYVGAQDCASGSLNVALSWTIQLNVSSFPSGGIYTVYASTDTTCTTGTDTNLHQIGNTINATSQTGGSSAKVSAYLSALSMSCPTVDTDIHLCVKLSVSGTVDGTATGSFHLQVTAPTAAPAGVQITPSEDMLKVSWDAVGGPPSVKNYLVVATNVADTSDVHKATSADTETSADVTGLTTPTTYYVEVFAQSYGGQKGPGSCTPVTDSAATGYPQGDCPTATTVPIDDFWEHYKNAGGREVGGCATAGGAGVLAALGVLVLALAVRARRRS